MIIIVIIIIITILKLKHSQYPTMRDGLITFITCIWDIRAQPLLKTFIKIIQLSDEVLIDMYLKYKRAFIAHTRKHFLHIIK